VRNYLKTGQVARAYQQLKVVEEKNAKHLSEETISAIRKLRFEMECFAYAGQMNVDHVRSLRN